jgi:hypothetical protein
VIARPWATVFVDDKPQGATPLSQLQLTPGTHTVRLENPGYLPLRRTLTIKPGETTALRVDLSQEAFRRTN